MARKASHGFSVGIQSWAVAPLCVWIRNEGAHKIANGAAAIAASITNTATRRGPRHKTTAASCPIRTKGYHRCVSKPAAFTEIYKTRFHREPSPLANSRQKQTVESAERKPSNAYMRTFCAWWIACVLARKKNEAYSAARLARPIHRPPAYIATVPPM